MPTTLPQYHLWIRTQASLSTVYRDDFRPSHNTMYRGTSQPFLCTAYTDTSQHTCKLPAEGPPNPAPNFVYGYASQSVTNTA